MKKSKFEKKYEKWMQKRENQHNLLDVLVNRELELVDELGDDVYGNIEYNIIQLMWGEIKIYPNKEKTGNKDIDDAWK